MSAELTIVIPTFNERTNIRPLIDKIDAALAGVEWEVVLVDDDSPDGTADHVRSIARNDPRIRCIQRVGRRGLSSACIEGLASSSAPYLGVMDADLQHDETLLRNMLDLLRQGSTDLVIGSRYVSGGGVGNWDGTRKRISRFATRLSQVLLKNHVADPMSGFFMIRNDRFWDAARNLSGRGFKILMDLIASSPGPIRIVELPFIFRPRHSGESKLDSMVALEHLMLLLDKALGWLIPLRFLLFVSVGGIGAVLHLVILGGFFRWAGRDFWISQMIASLCAMVLNFILNNFMTYRDRRLRGSKLVGGLLVFIVVCSVGAFTNTQIAEYLYSRSIPWWIAGLMGAAVGSVWNYGVSSQFVWRQARRKSKLSPPRSAT